MVEKEEKKKPLTNLGQGIVALITLRMIIQWIKTYWGNSSKTQKRRIIIWWIVYVFIPVPLFALDTKIGALTSVVVFIWGMYNLRKRSKEQDPDKYRGGIIENMKEGFRKKGMSESEVKANMRWAYLGFFMLILGLISILFIE